MSLHRKGFRRALLGASALAGAATMAMAAPAFGQAREVQFDLAPQPLSAALREYGFAADQQLIFAESDVRNLTAPALRGSYTPEQGLQTLLAGTGLRAERTPSGIVRIVSAQDPQGGSAGGGAEGNAVDALIVTAQKKEEAIQDVPIAISAFTQESLDAQKLEGGFDLLKAIPNVTFSKNNFTGYNFSIRGIGTKAVSATTDPGVAVSFNNTTLIVNRLFEQEYFDVERVEVLRGPQGTLYGRNATSGVINVLSARPRVGEFEGDLELEGGNYNAKRVKGMVNLPLGEALALRVAGAMTKRDGYGTNLLDGSDVDDRDLWSVRTTLGWEPTERFRANLLWERFEENDGRVRTSKQLCHRDPGPEFIGEIAVADHPHPFLAGAAEVSQGCLPGSLYDEGAFGTPNGSTLPFVIGSILASNLVSGFGFVQNARVPGVAECQAAFDLFQAYPIDICKTDIYGNRTQSRDLRAIESTLQPEYRAKADIFELSFDVDLTDSLTLSSQTVFTKDEVYSTQDFNRFKTAENLFQDTTKICGTPVGALGGPCTVHAPTTERPNGFYWDYAPGGIFTDPQLGASDTFVAQDISQAESEQFNQELRLVSNFDGPLNFSLGANYTRFETLNDYYVLANLFTYIAMVGPFGGHRSTCVDTGLQCIYIDPNPLSSINGEGHNYFRSQNPYELTSAATFGELYWQATDTLKITAGLRFTWDEKIFTPTPSQTLLFDYREFGNTLTGAFLPQIPTGAGPEACFTSPAKNSCGLAGNAPGGRGYPADPDIVQEWREPTGRIIVDWKPEVGFTDETMVYASYSHGYKGGGANPPSIAAPAGLLIAAARGADAPATFEPEFIDAFEVGTKNTLLGGGLILNASAFYYDYTGYQVSKIVDRSAANENFDSTVWGVELESIFSPTRNLRFNAAIGYLGTKIADGEQSIDLMDRTQGNPDWVVVKPWILNTSNCIAPTRIVEAIYREAIENGNNQFPGALCLGGTYAGFNFVSEADGGEGNTVPILNIHYNPRTDAPNAGAGFAADLSGNELPNAPHWTVSLGGQYTLALPGGWDATARVDYYWQGESYARVYNTEYDRLRAWENVNVSLWFEQPDWGVTAEVYVKNATDEMPITDAFLFSDDTGLVTNVFTLDPRLIGVSVRKSF